MSDLKLFTSLRNLSFTANCFHRTAVKCCHNHSEHNNRNCPVIGKITATEVTGSSWSSVCVPAGMSTAPAPPAEVGVAPVPLAVVARFFQLPSHRKSPQTTVRECCECHKRTISFLTLTQRTSRNVRVKKCIAEYTTIFYQTVLYFSIAL